MTVRYMDPYQNYLDHMEILVMQMAFRDLRLDCVS